MTGFTRRFFERLLRILWDRECFYPKVGHPSIVTHADKLGLVLFYLGSKMTLSELAMLFGVSVSLRGEIVNTMLELICARLIDHPDAKIIFPGADKKAIYAAMINAREPTVPNCVGFIDGCPYSVSVLVGFT